MAFVADKQEPAVSVIKAGDRTIETLIDVYRLVWIDKALHDAPAGATLQPYHRQRDFKHLGGAIAWGRRRIFHGEVFGDTIELSVVDRCRVNGVYQEDEGAHQEITLGGFQPWEDHHHHSYRSLTLAAHPMKRCILE